MFIHNLIDTVTMEGHAHAREVGIWFMRMRKKRSIF